MDGVKTPTIKYEQRSQRQKGRSLAGIERRAGDPERRSHGRHAIKENPAIRCNSATTPRRSARGDVDYVGAAPAGRIRPAKRHGGWRSPIRPHRNPPHDTVREQTAAKQSPRQAHRRHAPAGGRLTPCASRLSASKWRMQKLGQATEKSSSCGTTVELAWTIDGRVQERAKVYP